MTKQEAINWIKEHHLPDEHRLTNTNHDVAFRIAIECIEKQIPRKPKEIIKRQVYDPEKPFATIDVTQFTCPCCDGEIMFRKTVKRCLECGQLLDWSDNE